MRAAVFRQYRRTELIDSAEPDFGEARVLRDMPEAGGILRGFVVEEGQATALRRLLAGQGETLPLERLATPQVVEQVLQYLAQGRLRLAGQWDDEQWRKLAPRSRHMQSAAPVTDYVPTARPAAPREEPQEQPQEETPPVEADHQAAVLEEAARDGVPFCEECERLKRAGTPAQDAQAEALVAAAHDGVPFCEECERLKQEREQAAAAQEVEA